jgi:tRNA uracil 4-sulfurtransferase
MLLVVRFFPEITIKTRPVRQRIIRILRGNLLNLLRRIDADIRVNGDWDSFEIVSGCEDPVVQQQIEDTVANTPGIGSISRVRKLPLPDFEGILQHTKAFYADQLQGKTFAVRCRRHGKHDFTSVDVERYVGTGLFMQTDNGGVDLVNPQITVRINIQRDALHVVEKVTPGLGGFPLGSQDGVLSLISGGFDSAVSSYHCIRRGLVTHYCFFNLGGSEHELAVKELALYLWMKFGASHKVKFVSVPFEGVVSQIVERVESSQMGVVFKRMMMRAASQVAKELKLDAMVTGESVAQVSSQTLANLALIDLACDTLVLRPLITSDKQDIIDQARRIGTEEFSSTIHEYCSVISVKPTTRARRDRIESEEARLDPDLLDGALAQRAIQRIDKVVEGLGRDAVEPEHYDRIPAGAVVIDIRHPDEQEMQPLQLSSGNGSTVSCIPFYRLRSEFAGMDQQKNYLLYCSKGMMSRLHASHLKDAGYTNVGVYRPDL